MRKFDGLRNAYKSSSVAEQRAIRARFAAAPEPEPQPARRCALCGKAFALKQCSVKRYCGLACANKARSAQTTAARSGRARAVEAASVVELPAEPIIGLRGRNPNPPITPRGSGALTVEQQDAAIDMLLAGLRQRDVAASFGVTKNTIAGIWSRSGNGETRGPERSTLASRLAALDVFPAAGRCVFPIGLLRKGGRFCGEAGGAEGAPYCPHHRRLCTVREIKPREHAADPMFVARSARR